MPRHSDVPQWADDLQATLNHVHDHLVRLEHKVDRIMPTLQEIQASMDATLAKVTADDDVITSIATFVTDIKAQNDALKAKIDELIANGTASPAELQALSDTLGAINSKLDEQAVAEAAVTNTPAAPAP